VRAAVEAGIGATAISELAVESALKAGTLVRVGFKLPQRVFHAVRHRHGYHSRAAQAFMAMIDGRRP
jgi:DNA-binding transcriptional LysR family regulator